MTSFLMFQDKFLLSARIYFSVASQKHTSANLTCVKLGYCHVVAYKYVNKQIVKITNDKPNMRSDENVRMEANMEGGLS